MSYSIYIGEAQRVTEDSDYAGSGLTWYVPAITRPDAPQFDGDTMTGQSNNRHPGYAQWEEFTKEVGLYALFFEKPHGLMAQHPGCEFLTTEHYQTVKTARVAYQVKHVDAIPGWEDSQDPMLARLLWLEWWMLTTLTTAKVPAIYNS